MSAGRRPTHHGFVNILDPNSLSTSSQSVTPSPLHRVNSFQNQQHNHHHPPHATNSPSGHHKKDVLPAPIAFADEANADGVSDYATLLKRLKSKQRRVPREAEDVLAPSPSAGGARPFRSPSVVQSRRGSLPQVAAKYYEEPPSAVSPHRHSHVPTIPSPVLSYPPTHQQSTSAITTSSVGGYESEGYQSEAVKVAQGAEEQGQQRRKGRIKVVVRKRPVPTGEEDVVEVEPPVIHVNAQKVRIDLSEYTEAYQYAFDDAYGSHHKNAYVYEQCGKTLIDTVFEGGSASCFAYGQTGSGKTHTMLGTEADMGFYFLAAKDIFERCTPDHKVSVSLFEIYCNSLFDLLNARSVVIPREDSNKRVVICGLTWRDITSVADLGRWIERGSEQRRTGSTSANEFSSRSHAVMTISVRNDRDSRFQGFLKLVDLAGSERAADTAAHDRQTRLEGAEINKSLLALKECIRGLDERKKHIPFRGSKLTEVLRDSFEGNSRTVMIAAVTPAASSVVHTLNTLRYAFRVKGLSIDQNVVPSKQRKSKLAPARSKSTEPNPSSLSILAQPLPPLFMGKVNRDTSPNGLSQQQSPTDMSGDEYPDSGRRSKKHRKPRSRTVGRDRDRPDASVMNVIEAKVGAEIAGLRQEMLGVITKKDEEIPRLSQKNEDLERKLERLLMRIAKTESDLEKRQSPPNHMTTGVYHGTPEEY